VDNQNIPCGTPKEKGVVGNLCMSLTSLYPVLQRVDVETVDSLGADGGGCGGGGGVLNSCSSRKWSPTHLNTPPPPPLSHTLSV
jgi:hypothetical protein